MNNDNKNTNHAIIMNKLENISETQAKIEVNVDKIQNDLLDPKNGVWRKIQDNTDFREDAEEAKVIPETVANSSFRKNITRVMWIVISAIIGLIGYGIKLEIFK